MQLSYSRKVNRPAFFQVLPFVDFSDSLNLTIGNPALEPEFTQLAELNYNNQYKPGFSLFTTLYLKYTGNLVTRYQYRAPNTNPAKPDSVVYNSYANATSSYTAGMEITAKNKITGWWDLSSNLNLFDVTLDAGNIALVTSDHLFSWFAKLNNNFRLPRNYTVQLSGEYQAKTILPVNSGRAVTATAIGGGIYGTTPNIAQGYIEPYYGADLAIKKDFLKNKAASLTLQFNDIFRTRKYATHTDTGFFIQDNARRRDPQVLRLNFSWRFGRIDAALFKKKNMKADMESLQNLQQGQ
jgi:outer membrane receptor protein involved in Fe transport